MAPSRLETLSSQIAENTKIVDDYLAANGKKLSFEVDSELAFPGDAPEEVLTARRVVREATKELYDLVTGPAEHLRWLSCNVCPNSTHLMTYTDRRIVSSIMIYPVCGLSTI